MHSFHSIRPDRRGARLLCLAALCLGGVMPPPAVRAQAGYYTTKYVPSGSTGHNYGKYKRSADDGYAGTLANWYRSWSALAITGNHPGGSYSDSISVPYTKNGEWEYIGSGGGSDPFRPANSLLTLSSSGTVTAYVNYFLGAGETYPPDTHGDPTRVVWSNYNVIASGTLAGPVQPGSVAVRANTKTAINAGRGWISDSASVNDHNVHFRVVNKTRYLSSAGTWYLAVGTFNMSAGVLVKSDRSLTTTITSSTGGRGDGAQATSSIVFSNNPFGAPGYPPPSAHPRQSRGHHRWQISDQMRRALAAQGITEESVAAQDVGGLIYGGTITHEGGLNWAHSDADNQILWRQSGDEAEYEAATSAAFIDWFVNVYLQPLPADIADFDTIWDNNSDDPEPGAYGGSARNPPVEVGQPARPIQGQ